MMNRVLSFEHVSKEYRLGDTLVKAVDNISIEIDSGEFVAIVGPSGSGKSTILHIGAGLDKPSKGVVKLLDKEIQLLRDKELAFIRNKQVGFIFQSFNLIPVLTVYENIEYPCMVYKNNKHTYRDLIYALLKELDMYDKKDKRPNQLSGGEQQRVAIARALVNSPGIVFADEPTANLDHHTGEMIMDIMIKMNKKMGTTFLFSTHDPEIMKKAGRIITLKDGALISE